MGTYDDSSQFICNWSNWYMPHSLTAFFTKNMILNSKRIMNQTNTHFQKKTFIEKMSIDAKHQEMEDKYMPMR